MSPQRARAESLGIAMVIVVITGWAMIDVVTEDWGGVPLAVRSVAAGAACLPLLAMRRAPEVVAGTVTATLLGLGLGWPTNDVPPVLDVCLLVATFGLAAYASRPRPLLWAGFGVLAVVVNLQDSHERDMADGIWIAGTWAMTLAVGLLVSQREASERAHLADAAHTRDATPAATSEALAHERARIARDLHDVVTRSVAAMLDGAHAGRTAAVEGHDDDAAAELVRIETTGQSALAELRRMLDVMRGSVEHPAEPQPGLESLDQLVARSMAAGWPTRATLRGELQRVPAGVGVAAYRIVEEALDDVHRCAPGAAVDVAVTAGPEELTVEVRDDGPAKARPTSALRHRVELYGGRLDVGPESSPRPGWHVRAVLPI